MPTSKKKNTPGMPATIKRAVEVIEEKKAENIRVLDLRGQSSITDFVVIATGTSSPHLKGIKAALDASLKETGVHLIGGDSEIGSGWVIVDAFDFMVHLQTREMRALYCLDQLWKEAIHV